MHVCQTTIMLCKLESVGAVDLVLMFSVCVCVYDDLHKLINELKC